jgi:phosphoribosylformimino-5-aminoimidazole carboxamide ribotide isomerase
MAAVTRFRPCIDLHEGKVKQIVGGSLSDGGPGPRENFVSERGAGWFARRFRRDRLTGGHVIRLGPGNDGAAREALAAWPGGMQLGGGITADNAEEWLDAGAAMVIVTSHLFDGGGRFVESRLRSLARVAGPERLVVDLSCRRTGVGWTVAMNRWQTPTTLELTHPALDGIAAYCAEFLVHAADVEGLCQGVDEELVAHLGAWGGRPVTYAGGVASFDDLTRIDELSGGRVDVTVGSALDLFGGTGVGYDELVAWNRRPGGAGGGG